MVAPFVFLRVMRGRVNAVAFGGDDGLYACLFQLLADGIGIIAFVTEEGVDCVGYHAEQRIKPLDVMRLPWCQDETERAASGVASGMQFAAEASSQSAKCLGLLSPFFKPTAH